MSMTATGGDDTYRLLPYPFDHDELKNAACDKIFLGSFDTTINHLMLHKVGMKSFYGQAFLPDVCERSPEMLPYTRTYFEELIQTGTIRQFTPSPASSFFAARRCFPERSSAAASIRSLICSIPGGMGIRRCSLGNMSFCRRRKRGATRLCCWRAARS